MRRVAMLGAVGTCCLLLFGAFPLHPQMTTPSTGAAPPCYDNANRFVSCGNGTVTDGATGLIWLFDADCFFLDYAAANAAAATLMDGQCGLTDGSAPGDWRLATREEWEAIVDPSCPAPKIAGNGTNGGCFVDDPWASGIQSDYWSSSTDSTNTLRAWEASLALGNLVGVNKSGHHFVWPVRKAR